MEQQITGETWDEVRRIREQLRQPENSTESPSEPITGLENRQPKQATEHPSEGLREPLESVPEPVQLFADMKAALSGEQVGKQADLCQREDGKFLLYSAAINGLVGAPESGKTIIASTVIADELFSGNKTAILDLDHNGAAATGHRLRKFGVPESTLTDQDRFRFASPDDATGYLAVIRDLVEWGASIVLIDSVGEVLPMFNADSNNADDYTRVHRKAFLPLANSGAAVLLIDHEPKGDSKSYGATGSAAKKRAVDGALYRVEASKAFVPGYGGKATLRILKDRHGSVRANSLTGATGREHLAATFELLPGEATHWQFHPPQTSDEAEAGKAEADAQLIRNLGLNPTSGNDAYAQLKQAGQRIGKDRAQAAYKAWKQSLNQEASGSVPVPPLKGEGTRTTLTPVTGGQRRTLQGQGQLGASSD